MTQTESLWDLASPIAGHVNLRDIRLFKVESELFRPSTPRVLSYTLDTNVEFQTLGDDPVNAFVVNATFDLLIHEPADGEAEHDPAEIAKVDFTLAAMYFLDEDSPPFEDDQFDAFALSTGLFALYPYAREFVASMTGRMGLPPLHLATVVWDESGRFAE